MGGSLREQPDFAELYDDHIRQIYAYCLRRIAPADAQDVAAEIFAVVWRRWSDRPADGEITAWIYGIAKNVLANNNRSARRRSRLTRKLTGVRTLQDADPESTTVLHSEHDELLRAMEKLSPVERETLRLVEWEGLRREQVAELHGVTRSAIDQRISRAYQRLGAILGPDSVPAFVALPGEDQ